MDSYETPTSYDTIENNFNYHAPNEEKVASYEIVRESLRRLAHSFDEILPNGREKSLVFTKLEETMFWANASIARDHVHG